MEKILVVLAVLQFILILILLWRSGARTNAGLYIKELEAVVKEAMYQFERNQNSNFNEMQSRVSQMLSQISEKEQNQLNRLFMRNDETTFKMMDNIDSKMDNLRVGLEEKMVSFQSANEVQLERIRATVDEKLHKTLEDRLGESFKLVSERLELVHKGLGEMNVLVEGVGDLKKVLSNVKLRGVMGEVQLEQLLSQLLSPEQYVKNIQLNPNTRDIVEFAIKLPGRHRGEEVYIPVDAKFPIESYFRLTEAYENQDKEAFEKAQKEMDHAFQKNARDIYKKYVYPPVTTDFAIMFLPIEGLYAELTRRNDLLELLQREYRIIVAGPTNFAALLNSLQIGFRTLAIEQRTSEVWQLLATVKTEFHKFGAVLEKTQKKLSDAGSDLDQLIGVRSRKLIKELDKVTQMEEVQEEMGEKNHGLPG
ncbi:MAG: DNA recombination protein RmuC [Filifactor alocis]|nr:DNA recombination protein RmuC [Filifactor alocis]